MCSRSTLAWPREGGARRLSWPCCLECNRPLSVMMRSDARWCSPRCRQRAYRRTTRQSRNGTTCGFCGERLPPNKRSDARYCDAACRRKGWTHRYENDLERLQRELVALEPDDRRLKAGRMFRVFDTRRRSSRARRSVDQVRRGVPESSAVASASEDPSCCLGPVASEPPSFRGRRARRRRARASA